MEATPLLIQCASGLSDGSCMYMTKLVLWPVVESTPRLAVVLYTGQAYEAFFWNCALTPGFNHITGIVSYNILGYDSPMTIFSLSHLAPSMKRP